MDQVPGWQSYLRQIHVRVYIAYVQRALVNTASPSGELRV
jgi:hypothetical protein